MAVDLAKTVLGNPQLFIYRHLATSADERELQVQLIKIHFIAQCNGLSAAMPGHMAQIGHWEKGPSPLPPPPRPATASNNS